MRLHYSQLAAMLAEILIVAGRHQEAIEVLEEAIDRFQKYRDLLCAADLWTLKGDALLGVNAGPEEVESCCETALALARQLSAQVSALRAATRLAEFQRRHGREESGLKTLQELWAWFSEGHDTPDLLAAKTVLDSMQAPHQD